METSHVVGALLLLVAGVATWLSHHTRSPRAAWLAWIAYVVSLFGGAALLVP